MPTITEIWERIERELEAQFPHVLASLNPGATEEEIVVAEQAMGSFFLGDFRESLLRHNGQNDDEISLLGRGWLLPVEQILTEWQFLNRAYHESGCESDHYCESDPGIRPVWWHTRWIPFTQDCVGDHDCLDLAPAPGGRKGQIIEYEHDCARRRLKESSFKERLAQLAEALEQKSLVWDGRDGPNERWFWRTFGKLNTWELYDLMRLRQEVFVVEQSCVYLDADGYDQRAWHLLGRDGEGELVACLRLFAPGVKYPAFSDEASIGRVCTAASVRGTGLGQELMRRGIAEVERLWPGCGIRISAQAYLLDFYGKLGFVAVSEPYDEDGIPHVEMVRPAKTPRTVQ